MQLVNKGIIKHKEIYFDSILYIMYVKEMSNLHTHNAQIDLFGVVKYFSLRGEGRWDLKVGLWY